MEQSNQRYYFILQIKAIYGDDWFLTSEYAWESPKAFLDCISEPTKEQVVAVTKIKKEIYEAAKTITKSNQ